MFNNLLRDVEDLKNNAGNAGGSVFDGDANKLLQDLSSRLQQLENRVTALEKKLSSLQRQGQNTVTMGQTPTDGIDGARFDDLENRFNNHLDDYDQFKKEITSMLAALQDQMNDKADYSRLSDLEKMLMDKLQEVYDDLTKKLADKGETKKTLKALERQLKNLLELFMNRTGNPDEDNAMFSKKPLGGFSCASCEKNLINLNGKPPEYHTWN